MLTNLAEEVILGRAHYALIMPVRDEECFIAEMIESVLAQDVLPKRWLIIDDGSTDHTPEILDRYAQQHPFLEVIHRPSRNIRNPGGESAVYHLLPTLDLGQYAFLARFDADLILPPHYFLRLLQEFAADSRLGIAGGGLYIDNGGTLQLERVPEFHVRGALKMYRRECLQDIGGLHNGIGWDTIDEVYAWSRGWRTKSFFQYKAIHRRPTGDGSNLQYIYSQRGKAEYYTWSLPGFVLAKSLKYCLKDRKPVAAAAYWWGFAACYCRREKRLQDEVFAQTRRRQQRRRISAAIRSFYLGSESRVSSMSNGSSVLSLEDR